MKSGCGIVVVGSIIYDFRVTADSLPRPGETLEGYGFGTGTGGKGANQAVAAAKLGAKVDMIGRVGPDIYGDMVLGEFDRSGLGRRFVFRDPSAPTATCLIHIDKNGENDIIIVPGANGRVSVTDVETARGSIEKAGVLMLQNEVPLSASLRAVDIARKAGALIILNPAPAKPLPTELFSRIDFFTPNETEAQYYTGVTIGGKAERAEEAADVLLGMGIKNILITMGRLGAYYATRQARRFFPSFRIIPVDTTAAGDAFNGALAVMLSEGRGIHDAVRFANAAGAVCASRAGAQSALGNRDEVETLVRESGMRLSYMEECDHEKEPR